MAELYDREKIPDDLQQYFVRAEHGLEPTPESYVENLVDVFREVRRVLRPDGTLWLNLGDSYAGSFGAQGKPDRDDFHRDESHPGRNPQRRVDGLKPKDMVGIPWRVAFALQADGWWLRSDIIWRKPNPMPESVTDRPTSSHEHIFLLAKSETYYYDHEAIKEEGSPNAHGGGQRHSGRYAFESGRDDSGEVGGHARTARERGGRNKRDVWTVTTKPYPDAHFAVYPPELITPCVKAGTSEKGQCAECGAPWGREVEREAVGDNIGQRDDNPRSGIRGSGLARPPSGAGRNGGRTVGWTPTCDCDADTEPQLVLDPFAGAGTTGVVCTELGRRFLGIELNPEYAEMARERILGTNPTLFRGTA